jgi:hypothetical protein
MSKWRDPEYLRKHFGTHVVEAGLFNSSEPEERLGIMPHQLRSGGIRLRVTYKKRLTLKRLLNASSYSDFVGTSWFAEQSTLYDNAAGLYKKTKRPKVVNPKMWSDIGMPALPTKCHLMMVSPRWHGTCC